MKIVKKEFMFGLLILTLLISTIGIVNSLSNDEKEYRVYVETKFGCLPLKDIYTQNELNAKLKFYDDVRGFRPTICGIKEI